MSELAKKIIAENIEKRQRGEDARVLDLGNCGLQGSLPEELFDPYFIENLEWLSLGDRFIRQNDEKPISTPNEGENNVFSGEEPDLYRLAAFKSLKYLYISYYGMRGELKTASFLENCQKLERLGLWGNQLTHITQIPSLPLLEDLRISYNKIENLKECPELPSLRVLDVGQNDIEDISGLGTLGELTWLDLSENQIRDITSLANLTGLVSLNIQSNQIVNIHPLDALQDLVSLKLDSNQISAISPLEKLTGLTSLSLGGNQIRDHNPLKYLFNLKSLDLRGNSLRDIRFLEKLINLTDLDLWNNQITNLHCLEPLNELRSLNLGGNQVSGLGGIEKLRRLTKLSLRDNQVNNIGGLEYLIALAFLDLSSNQISDLRPLANLIELTSLYLWGNKIVDPRGLDNLVNLSLLDLGGNQIMDISPLLPLIKKGMPANLDGAGSGINLRDNPLTTPPPEIIQQGKAAILRHFKERERLEKQDLPVYIKVREAKVLLVGQGKAGKTSLRRKLEDLEADMPAPGDTTRGIEITRLKERMPHTKESLRLNFWDFGGQDIQHYAHQFFLTGSSLYVLVTNERIQDSVHLPYWLNIIEMLGQKSPVLIVQNMDGGNCQPLKDEAAIRSRFANVYDRTFQSDFSKANKEIAFGDLRKTIVELASKLPHIERDYLRSFNDLRGKLEAEADQKTHYLRWEDYLALMPELGEDLMRDYANALTFLGVCQYFPKDALLSQYVFLRPKWLIDALFELLLHPYFEDSRGLFLENDTFKIWKGKEYKGMHVLLVRMMKEFELCYRVEGDEEKYIVPQRLPGENKSYGWDEKGDVPVQFRYKFMPKGILTRLICRLHTRIEKDPTLGDRVWNDSVIFTLPNGKGRVFAREVYSENTIELRAQGSKHAEMLNEVIRKMDDINRDAKYDNLQVEKLMPCPCAECITAESPGFHEFDALQKRIEKGKQTSECKKSGEDVPIDEIFGKSGVAKPRGRDDVQEYGMEQQVHKTTPNLTKILMLMANPRETDKLNLEREHARIHEVLSRQHSHFKLQPKYDLRITDLNQAIIRERPDIVHFSGHGRGSKLRKANPNDLFEEPQPGENGGLLMENPQGDGPFMVSASSLAFTFESVVKTQGIPIQIVLLNACHSTEQAEAIAQYVPFVIGTSDKVLDEAAWVFSKGFYFSLAHNAGQTIGEAAVHKAFNMGQMNAVNLGEPTDRFVLYVNGSKA